MEVVRSVALCCVILAACTQAEEWKAPEASGSVHFAENFQDPTAFATRWVKSSAKKEGTDEDIAKYNGEWSVEAASANPLPGDVGLVLKDKAKHAAISVPLDRPFEFTDKPLVFQYEFKQQDGLVCGGSYVKLLSQTDNLDLAQFTDKTGYSIMFGPDMCGMDSKVHFIFRHKNPKTGEFEEKHADMKEVTLPDFRDKKNYLIRLVVRPDNTFTISINEKALMTGNLLESMNPPVNPPAEIDDPEDKRPEDWDDQEKIPDPDASKPDDWDEDAPSHIPDMDATMPSDWLVDEPEHLADPNSEKPEDWDVDEDGEYEAPLIANPKCEAASGCGPWTRPTKVNPAYKGQWKAPMIDNPKYQGIWKPRKIANPGFFEDMEPFRMSPIGAIGLELWTMTENQLFDNMILTDDESVADQYAADGFKPKKDAESSGSTAHGLLTSLLEATTERPWLWAVYVIVVIVLPIVIIVACCLPSKKDPEAERRARAKKTDEPQPDDRRPEPVIEEAEEEEEEEEGQEEEEEEEEEEEAPVEEPKEEAPSSPKAAEAEPVAEAAVAEAQPAQELSVPDDDEDAPRRSPRKPTKKKARREN